MSQDRTSNASPDDLPEPMAEWLAETAADRDVSPAGLLRRLLTVAAESEPVGEALEERLDELDGRVDELDADVTRQIDDVRDRVVQVKRETDAKAPVDHDHPALDARLDDVSDRIGEIEDSLDELEARIETSEGPDDSVGRNGQTESVERKLDVLANAILDLREGVSDVTTYRARQAVVDEFRAEANRLGVRHATCGDCDESVDLSLLAAPACPHCGEELRDLDHERGLFGSTVLRTGSLPASDGSSPGESADGE